MAVQSLNFAAAVNEWVKETQDRMVRVFRTAADLMVEDVIRRTPVDTGYLRASLTVTLDAPLPIRPEAKGGVPLPQAQPYSLTIAGAEIGDTIFGSFVASYAAYVEYGTSKMAPRRMVGLAAQSWQAHVDKAVSMARAD